MPGTEALPVGLYESVISAGLEEQLHRIDEAQIVTGQLDHDLAALALSQLVQQRLLATLQGLTGEHRLARQIALVNDVLALLESSGAAAVDRSDFVSARARQLLEIKPPRQGPLAVAATVRPRLPLRSTELIVNGRHDLRIGLELGRELASANRVELLCSFLKWSGVRLIEAALGDFLARHPGGLRVLTTTYMGATERRALDRLRELGAGIRISYDHANTRLHAKAWLIRRDSGFDTAYIGSSNLSHAAMLDGLEWNVRFSACDNAAVIDKFEATFNHYWDEADFVDYCPEQFQRASDAASAPTPQPHYAFDIHPKYHQAEMLASLQEERRRGHTRNLIVAATGTGKTVVAALDYQRLCRGAQRPRLLFIAHRREILNQSLATYRAALKDGDFGDALFDGSRPRQDRHLFASIQSLNKLDLGTIAHDYYEIIVVDEFHHASAASYERVLQHFAPRLLLGLTATPERADGRSVLGWFDHRIAYELRLWKALDQQLLAPFQYFGIGTELDLRQLSWRNGRYATEELSKLYTAGDWLVQQIAREVAHKVTDSSRMRALGFCIDVNHAQYMTAQFARRGIAAACLTGATDHQTRAGLIAQLRGGAINVIFCVDVFNEGVDIPEVDTLLLLRPTESATVFLQQLGRGLRIAAGKECLTVLDFVGYAHQRFRFDRRFAAIIGGSTSGVLDAVAGGFPALPSGCSIQLDRIAQERVVENIRANLQGGFKRCVDDFCTLRASDPGLNLSSFLAQADLTLEDLFGSAASSAGYSELKRRAGLRATPPTPQQARIEKALGRCLHLNDSERIRGIRDVLLERPASDHSRLAACALLGETRQPVDAQLPALLAAVRDSYLGQDIDEVLAALDDRIRQPLEPLQGIDCTLKIGGRYSLTEIMAEFRLLDSRGAIAQLREGVKYLAQRSLDLFFVTLEKSDKEYTPSTLYNDYALSQQLFHWETQSGCHDATATGQRYQRIARGGPDGALLFVRASKRGERGETLPYTLLGPCYYRSHSGNRPMQIVWELAHPIPVEFYQEVKVAAG